MKILLKDKGVFAGADDLNGKLNAVIDGLNQEETTTIVLDKGIYDMSLANAVNKVVYMTNTVSEKEMAIPDRQIGIYLENRKNLVIDGGGSTLIYHGRMTEFMLRNCENVTIKNFNVDFDKATVAEFKVVKISGASVTLDIIKDSEYEIRNNKIVLKALDGITGGVVVQECDFENKFTKRIDAMSWSGDVFERQLGAKQNADGTVTMSLPFHFFKEGMIYQVCKIRRDACGTFIDSCKAITLLGNHYYFMHGMGILSQLSSDITIEKCAFTPNVEKNRTTCAFADMIHCSMCSGDIVVRDCEFDGSRDDIINVHGNHWVVTKVKGATIEVAFRHPQAYGFLGIKSGDTVEFINRKTLTGVEKIDVVSAEMVDKYITRITLASPVTKGKAGMALENYSRGANLLVEGIKAYNIPTRGILVTTKGKVIIRNNLFNKMYMSAILMSDDANNWYESSYVRDITIENNQFLDCRDWIIDALPEAKSLIKRPYVHENITVRDNYIELNHNKVARVKRTRGFVFENNTLKMDGEPRYDIKDSESVSICNNKVVE